MSLSNRLNIVSSANERDKVQPCRVALPELNFIGVPTKSFTELPIGSQAIRSAILRGKQVDEKYPDKGIVVDIESGVWFGDVDKSRWPLLAPFMENRDFMERAVVRIRDLRGEFTKTAWAIGPAIPYPKIFIEREHGQNAQEAKHNNYGIAGMMKEAMGLAADPRDVHEILIGKSRPETIRETVTAAARKLGLSVSP